MNIWDKFITGKHNITRDDLMYSRLVFFHFLAVIGFLLLIIFVFVDFQRGYYPTAAFELLLALILFVSLILIRYKQTLRIALILGSLIIMALCLFNFISGGFEGAGILWVFLFPPIIFLLRGFKFGIIWSVAFFLVLIVMAILSTTGVFLLPYTLYNTWISIGILFFVSIIIIVFSRIQLDRSEIISRQAKQVFGSSAELKKANKELKKAAKERQETIAELKKQKEQAEKMNELMVGREKKIIEMKEEIKKLKSQ